MSTLGIATAIISGIVLGLTGIGGSILTIPILVYLFDIKPVMASAYSLFTVGCGAVVGVFSNYRKKFVRVKTAIEFAIPSLIAVYTMRYYIVPAIPAEWFRIGDFVYTKNMFTMMLLGAVMCYVAIPMIKQGNSQQTAQSKSSRPKRLKIITDGLIIGILSGAIGVGGGFLIVPTLVIRMRMSIKIAVGTSFLIIAINSFVGFIGDIQHGRIMDWALLMPFTFFMIGGVITGSFLSRYVAGEHLKKAMGWLILALSIYILFEEFIVNLGHT